MIANVNHLKQQQMVSEKLDGKIRIQRVFPELLLQFQLKLEAHVKVELVVVRAP